MNSKFQIWKKKENSYEARPSVDNNCALIMRCSCFKRHEKPFCRAHEIVKTVQGLQQGALLLASRRCNWVMRWWPNYFRNWNWAWNSTCNGIGGMHHCNRFALRFLLALQKLTKHWSMLCTSPCSLSFSWNSDVFCVYTRRCDGENCLYSFLCFGQKGQGTFCGRRKCWAACCYAFNSLAGLASNNL